MSVVDEVAGLPGGQTLAAIAQQVLGGPAAVHDLANRWSKAANDTTVCAAAVRGTVLRVGQTWLGGSNAAFTDLMSQFDRASGVASGSLSNAGATLTQLSSAFEQARISINRICENLLIQASQVRAVYPGNAFGDEQIKVLVGQATQVASAVITTLESALNQASTVLGAELLELSQTFSALPQPGRPDPDRDAQAYGRMLADVRTSGDNYGRMLADPGTSDDTVMLKERDPIEPFLVTERVPADTVPVAAGTVLTTVGTSEASPSGVQAWIREATRILVASGVPESQVNPEYLELIIQHESSGDPLAVNNWDYNAAAGTPSIGLMQTIEPTFRAYALPGHGDIRNPVDNIIAGTRYALARYGSLGNVPGVIAVHNGQPYVGY
jgi:uncharacterized protein YukE